MRLAQPFAVQAADHVAGRLRGIVPVGVFHRGEFLFADDAERHHGTELREGVEQELLELPALLDAADGLAGGVPGQLARLQFPESCNLEQVNRDVSAVEDEAPVGIRHVAVAFGEVAVFHDAGLLVLECENAHLFLRVGLVDDLGGAEAAALGCECPDEGRVADAAERVVDAVEEYVLHAFFHEPGERAALGKCAEAAAVAVGDEGEAAVIVDDGLAFRVEGADGALLEEADVLAGVSEEVVLGKEVDGRLVVEGARHDAPGNGMLHPCGEVQQAFRLQLEQTLVARQADVEHALGAIETETRTLSARDEERGNLPLAEQNLAGLFPEVVTQVVDGNLERHWLQIARNVIFERCA